MRRPTSEPANLATGRMSYVVSRAATMGAGVGMSAAAPSTVLGATMGAGVGMSAAAPNATIAGTLGSGVGMSASLVDAGA